MASEPKFWPVAAKAEPVPATPTANRDEVLIASAIRRGWWLVVIGVVIPPLLILSGRYGYALQRAGHRQGGIMLGLSVAIFALRLAYYLS